MGLARERRGDAGAYPAVCIADPYGRNSAFRERLGRARADQWPDDVFEAYLHAFVLDLAAGNVALVQRPRSGYEAPEYFVVDLEIWKSIVDGYRLGEMLVSSDPYKEWRPRSRWRRLQL